MTETDPPAGEDAPVPTIGFASTCMNRRWQLEQTLGDNLGVLARSPHFLALCDYNSGDDLGSLLAGFEGDLRSGRLIYFRTTEPRSYHSSMAKNTAHRLALRRRPDVLFNLDADNRITRETLRIVENTFRHRRDTAFHNWSGQWGTGTSGRVALAAERWRELGGYDEKLLPVGWQDLDLLYRARLLGLHYQPCPHGIGPSVHNSDRDKIAHAELPDDLAGATPSDTYTKTFARNIVTALGRPVRLPLEDQRRFTGQLNFGETLVI